MKPGDVIFLSASVPTREPWKGWCDPVEIEEAIVCVARAVFARGGRLLFGGHPSVSPLIAAVAGEYFPPDPARVVRPIVIFQSRLFQGLLPDETHLMARMGWAAIEWTERPGGTDSRDKCLRVMREAMLSPRPDTDAYRRNALRRPRAMFGIGGMEGVVDEAARCLGATNGASCEPTAAPPMPVFLYQSGGGAAGVLADLWDSKRSAERVYIIENYPLLAEQYSQLRPAERLWLHAYPGAAPDGLPFQPYAAITQWLLDDLQ